MKLPLYIHIPFCRRKCDYCDFYSIDYSKELARSYINTLIGQIKSLKDQGFSFSTVYIGGGTPSVLDEYLLERLLKTINCPGVKETTLEANPESLTRPKLEIMRNLGLSRISIGVQSFDNKVLSFLGRVHNKAQALKAVELAEKTGFKNISIDLIFGLPKRGLDFWKKELSQAAALEIKHISLYSLTYEKGTPLYSRLKSREFSPIGNEEEAEMYSYSIDFLSKKKFFQYEVSNFSKRGFDCRHNLFYWDNSSYLGLGASAVSYVNGVRKKYTLSVQEYVKKARGLSDEAVVEQEKLSPLRRAKETAALNIRRAKGINFLKFAKNTGFDFLTIEAKAKDKLLEEKLIVLKKRNSRIFGIKLTRKGFLFCDKVCREFL
ncbi:MAG: radical SAM family heme chaperone HemW [Candidatus Omnitrophica bacterium]|nr:radical SAM family heme chaperone HemW [Candidatus Omnitrophota bacterium]